MMGQGKVEISAFPFWLTCGAMAFTLRGHGLNDRPVFTHF
jgi:hypothetical protein